MGVHVINPSVFPAVQDSLIVPLFSMRPQTIILLVTLLTWTGSIQQLIAQSETYADSLSVHVFLHDECVISQFYTPELNRLVVKYQDQPVGFVGHFPNPSADVSRIDAFTETFDLHFPLVPDYEKDMVKALGVRITPEVAVWDHRTGRLIYRGRIDDSYVRVGKRKRVAQSHDLEKIIDLWSEDKVPEKLVETRAIGCFINFTSPLDKNE